MPSLSQPFEDLLITPVNEGPFFIDALFRRKFAHAAPEFGTPLICFYRKSWDHFIPVCHVLYFPFEEVILVGGGMTDGEAFKQMPETLRASVRQSGGIFYHVLRFGFEHFSEECEAFFGYAGDKRAYEVDIRAGFSPTGYQHLIANFHKPISPERKHELIEKVHAIGPF
jgi:hypothetical protein